MHHKNIKQMVRRQLKKQSPNWELLPKKAKKAFSKNVLTEVVLKYDLKQEVNVRVEGLLAIET